MCLRLRSVKFEYCFYCLREEKEKWIRAKYEQKEFLPPPPYHDVPLPQVCLSVNSSGFCVFFFWLPLRGEVWFFYENLWHSYMLWMPLSLHKWTLKTLQTVCYEAVKFNPYVQLCTQSSEPEAKTEFLNCADQGKTCQLDQLPNVCCFGHLRHIVISL